MLSVLSRWALRPRRIRSRPHRKSVVTVANMVTSPFDRIELPKLTIPQFIWQNLDSWPDQVGIECGITGKSYTYSQIHKMSLSLGASLLKLGLRPGDVVTLLMPNMPEFAVTVLGVLEAGLILSPANPTYTPDEIFQQLKDSESKCIIAHPENVQKALMARRKLDQNIIIISIHDFNGVSKDLPPGVRPFSDLVKSEVDTSILSSAVQNINLDGTSCLPYSSGTTGLPKGVCLTHSSIVANLAQCSHPQMTMITDATKTSQDVIPGILPFFHVYGKVLLLLQGLSRGAKLVTLPKFDPENFLKILESNREIDLYLVPPLILFLGSHPGVKGKHLEHIKFVITGGAPCAGTDIEKILQKKKMKIFQAYGMTESSPLLTYPDFGCVDNSTVGVPICNTLGKIVSLETGKDLAVGEIGELCFRGPQLMKGYHEKPEATAETIDDDGWLHTGDIGHFNSKGYFYIEDRKKELIKVKGHQVAPAELEAVLRQHPHIMDAGVVAIPHTKNGEAPLAFIVIKPGSTINLEQVKKFVDEKVAPYKRISKVITLDSIPKSLSGKILRRELKEMALKNCKNE